MSSPAPKSKKRPRPESISRAPSAAIISHVKSDADKVLETISSRKNRGIWLDDIANETGISKPIVTKQLNILQNRGLIKGVTSKNNKGKKIYMAAEYEPSDEITGGMWYSDGNLDTVAIAIIRRKCLQQIENLKVATCEMILKGIKKTEPKAIYSLQQINDVVQALVLDKEVEEIRSSGKGDFANVPAGKVCFKKMEKRGAAAFALVGSLSSIPCGVCPRLKDCTPHGVISPTSCVYYRKWIQWDF